MNSAPNPYHKLMSKPVHFYSRDLSVYFGAEVSIGEVAYQSGLGKASVQAASAQGQPCLDVVCLSRTPIEGAPTVPAGGGLAVPYNMLRQAISHRAEADRNTRVYVWHADAPEEALAFESIDGAQAFFPLVGEPTPLMLDPYRLLKHTYANWGKTPNYGRWYLRPAFSRSGWPTIAHSRLVPFSPTTYATACPTLSQLYPLVSSAPNPGPG